MVKMENPLNSIEDCDSLMFIIDMISDDETIIEFEANSVILKNQELGELIIGMTLIGMKKKNPLIVLGCSMTRLIFWHLFLIKYPEFKSLFDDTFSGELYKSLSDKNLLSLPLNELKLLTTEEIFDKMNDNVCFHCGKTIYSRNKSTQCKCHFAVSERIFHYIIAGIIKNKWTGDYDEGFSVFKLGLPDVTVEFKTNSHLRIDQFGENSYHACVRASFRNFLNLILPDDDYNITI
jgi:ribosomal protein L37E